jgi:hypothetical protein
VLWILPLLLLLQQKGQEKEEDGSADEHTFFRGGIETG